MKYPDEAGDTRKRVPGWTLNKELILESSLNPAVSILPR